MRVKICGITNLEDALNAVDAKADALGFVFYKASPRYISVKNALNIIEKLPPFVQIVGLFVNENEDFINQTCKKAKIQLAQIIDDDKVLNCSKLEVKYTKVIRAKTREDLLNLDDEYYLVDAFVDGFGGKGKRVDLEIFRNIDCSKFILAGGLNKDNLKELNGFGFFGVDVSSSVEIEKGKKDKKLMFDFIKVANEIL